MNEIRATITSDQKPELLSLLRRLPSILAGSAPDVAGIASGFKARVGYAILSLIIPNFNDLGRGMTGVDGTKWPPLSPEYLAYRRRFGPGEKSELKKAAGLDRRHRFAPGGKEGLLSKEQLKLWRQVYSDRLAFYVMRLSDRDAKARAAAIAHLAVKEAGGKTKLEVYGGRQVQILVDTGRLRGSLMPGTLTDSGIDANYSKPSGKGGPEQIFELETGRIVVGTNVKYGVYHHAAKNPRRLRRMWPEKFPEDWWRQILGAALTGLQRIADIYRAGGV